MQSRQVLFCAVNHIFIFFSCIWCILNAGILVHIVVAISPIGMGDIQVIIEIVAGIEIRMLPAFDIVIQAFRRLASFLFCGRRNMIDLPGMIICSSESQLSCLEGSRIILDAIIAKSSLDHIRTLTLGDDIDAAAICLRAIQDSAPPADDFDAVDRFDRDILEIVPPALIDRHAINQNQRPFFDTTNDRLAGHGTLRNITGTLSVGNDARRKFQRFLYTGRPCLLQIICMKDLDRRRRLHILRHTALGGDKHRIQLIDLCCTDPGSTCCSGENRAGDSRG